MIYEEFKPTFEDLISNLEELKNRLKNLDWKYELSF
jgi:hypothetical protein